MKSKMPHGALRFMIGVNLKVFVDHCEISIVSAFVIICMGLIEGQLRDLFIVITGPFEQNPIAHHKRGCYD